MPKTVKDREKLAPSAVVDDLPSASPVPHEAHSLTPEQGERFERRRSEKPRPPTPAVRRAIEHYKRFMAGE